MQLPFVAARPRILPSFRPLVLPRSAQLVSFRIQQCVQRLFHRGSHHLIQVCLNLAVLASFSAVPPGSIFRPLKVLLLLLVPAFQSPAQIKCAKNSLRYRDYLAAVAIGVVHLIVMLPM